MLRISRHWTFAATALVLAAQPALAQAHSYKHGRHHRVAVAGRHRDSVRSRRYASTYWSRGSFAAADRQTYQSDFDFAPQPAFGGYAEQYASPHGEGYARRPRSYFGRTWSNESFGQGSNIESMAEQQASANGIPTSLVDRVIKRESGGNPRAVSRGNYGLMQIRLGTAREMGYGGSAAGLLDAQTNMTYAVRYLAGAYRAAGGNESRAVALYARGYNAARVQTASYQPHGASGGSFGFSSHQEYWRSRQAHGPSPYQWQEPEQREAMASGAYYDFYPGMTVRHHGRRLRRRV